MKNILISLSIMFLLIGCDDAGSPQINNELLGVWIHKEYQDDKTILIKASEFISDSYGIKILPNNKIIERKNSGWCGTPPISYSNFEGKWEKLNENLIEIEVDYWGGITTYNIEIISLNQNELIVKYHYRYEN